MHRLISMVLDLNPTLCDCKALVWLARIWASQPIPIQTLVTFHPVGEMRAPSEQGAGVDGQRGDWRPGCAPGQAMKRRRVLTQQHRHQSWHGARIGCSRRPRAVPPVPAGRQCKER